MHQDIPRLQLFGVDLAKNAQAQHIVALMCLLCCCTEHVTCQLKADYEVLFWHGFGTASGFDYVERLSLRGWESVDSAVGPYRT